ncbi:SseB family protein [Stenotrophomonas sp. C3(2023)]|uniref:SseB family protein n=1 Tax=Stenotrophomonas sp. C3(2023) TaxID=3080277 RepID=UPI00293C2B03|nr:SseB family protein [Stenotrophomonas sp. C3(2023)]MDV3467540.1 SseB family protein [Stenotrophomonas sp. C3(2023)]
MQDEDQFEALNDLEVRLLQAQDGTLTAQAFLDGLLTESVIVLLDKPVAEDSEWDDATTPLVLTNEAEQPMFAVFTAVDRARPWAEQLEQFENALQVEFQWLVGAMAEGVGIVLNPGFDVGMEIVPEAMAQLKERAAAFVRAAGTH